MMSAILDISFEIQKYNEFQKRFNFNTFRFFEVERALEHEIQRNTLKTFVFKQKLLQYKRKKCIKI